MSLRFPIHYESAGRDDLAAQEKFELELIAVYLPEALSDDEVAALIKQAIAVISVTKDWFHL